MPEQHHEELHGDDGWFKRHIIEGLRDLKEGQRDLSENMTKLTEAMRTHEISDDKQFNELKQDIQRLNPVQRIVYGGVGLVLSAVLIALVALVVKGRP